MLGVLMLVGKGSSGQERSSGEEGRLHVDDCWLLTCLGRKDGVEKRYLEVGRVGKTKI